ncbi:MAG: M50 family metallopeptidase [Gammaproteobacteria bacterium]
MPTLHTTAHDEASRAPVSRVREVGGRFFAVSPTMAAVIDSIARRAPAAEIHALLHRAHPQLEPAQLHALLSQLFRQYGVGVEQHGTGDQARFGFTPAASAGNHRGARYLQLACTLLPGKAAHFLSRHLTPLYRPAVAAGVLISALLLLLAFVRQDGARSVSLAILSQTAGLTPLQWLAATAAIFLCLLFHELGHSAAAWRFGIRVRRIGIGLYWIFPVLFSDVTDIWKLPRRRRLVVDLGGVYFQAVALLPLLAFGLLTREPGWRAAAAFVIAINVLTIVVNLNPLLRYDGYWIYSDLSGIPNLRRQSNALLRTLSAALFTRTARSRAPALVKRNPALFTYGALSLLFSGLFIAYLAASVAAAYAGLPRLLAALESALHGVGAWQLSAGMLQALLSGLWSLVPLAVMPVLILYALSELYLLLAPGGGRRKAPGLRRIEIP